MSDDDARNGRRPAPATDGDLSQRLDRLKARLDEKRPAASAASPSSGSAGPSAMGKAFRMSAEFVAGVIAGGGLGWLIDRFAGTSPWGLMVFLLLGFGAGVWNVMRASGFLKPAAPTERDATPRPRDKSAGDG